MSQAAYKKAFDVSTVAIVLANVRNGNHADWIKPPITDVSLNLGANLLDDTEIDGDGFMSRIQGLKDWSVNLTCNYMSANTALNAIRSSLMNDTILNVRYLPSGRDAGGQVIYGECKVESMNDAGPVNDLETIAITLQGTGLLSFNTLT